MIVAYIAKIVKCDLSRGHNLIVVSVVWTCKLYVQIQVFSYLTCSSCRS